MGLGFLGALGGAGEGMASVGKSWADELKQQRIQESRQTHRTAERAEDRAHQATLRAEDRAHQATLKSEDRTHQAQRDKEDRAFRSAESEKERTARIEQDEAKANQEMERDKMRAKLGLGVTSGEGPSKKDRIRLDAYKTYLDSEESDKEGDNYKDFKSWAADEVGLTIDPAGVKAVEKAVKEEGQAAAPAKPAGKEPPPGTKVRGPDGKLMIYRGNGQFEPIEGSF